MYCSGTDEGKFPKLALDIEITGYSRFPAMAVQKAFYKIFVVHLAQSQTSFTTSR